MLKGVSNNIRGSFTRIIGLIGGVASAGLTYLFVRDLNRATADLVGISDQELTSPEHQAAMNLPVVANLQVFERAYQIGSAYSSYGATLLLNRWGEHKQAPAPTLRQYSVYTKEHMHTQMAAIRKCMALMQVRLDYNNALLVEIKADGEYFREHMQYASRMHGVEIGEAELAKIIETQRQRMIVDINADLDRLQKIHDNLREMLEGREDGIPVAFSLIACILIDKSGLKSSLGTLNSYRDQIVAEYRSVRMQYGNEAHPIVKAARQKSNQDLETLRLRTKEMNELSEAPLYELLLSILRKDVFSDMERDLERLVEIKLSTDNIYPQMAVKPEFLALMKSNVDNVRKLIESVDARHKEAVRRYPQHEEHFKVDYPFVLSAVGMPESSKPENELEFFEIYRSNYKYKGILEAFNKQDKEAVKNDLRILDVKAKAALQARYDAERLQNALAAQEANLARQTLAAQQQLAAEQAEAATRAEREQLALERTQRRAAAAADYAKRQEELQTLHASETVEAEKQKQFKVPNEVILAYFSDLEELFAPTTKKYRYNKIATLVKRLDPVGGRLEKGTKSGHMIIIFNDLPATEIEIEEDDENIDFGHVKGGISRPHGKHKDNTHVRHHNLILVRRAIAKVLPDDWRELEARADAAPMQRPAP